MATQTAAQKKSKAKKSPVSNLNVAYILDMSGSMGSATAAAREGTRNYLGDPNTGLHKQERDLIKENGKSVYTRFSLTVFDTVFEKWVVDQPVLDVPLNFIDRYQPRGNTALYDAIANTITDLETLLKKTGRADEKCLVVVMTDGQENSSREYGGLGGRQRIFDLIKAYEAKGNWTFVYLGADVDTYAESASMGFAAGNTASYSKDATSYHLVSASLGQVTNARRASGMSSSSSSFDDAGVVQDFNTKDDPSPGTSTGTSPGPNHWANDLTVDPNSMWNSSSAIDATKKAR